MATYKVLQDIEAEDKFLGPLTLRQFIYAAIMATCLYLSLVAFTREMKFALVFLLPAAGFTGILAWPWMGEQSTEVWLLAKLRFHLKPRRRLWDQSGMKQLVTITAPKKEETVYTDGLSQTEVKSRLKALAQTIDSRGWAIKNVNVDSFDHDSYRNVASSPDRLVGLEVLPQEVSGLDIQAADDILDEQNNPIAQQFEQMIKTTDEKHHKGILEKMRNIREQGSGADNESDTPWFMQPQFASPPAGYTNFDTRPHAQESGSTKKLTADEAALLSRVHQQEERMEEAFGHKKEEPEAVQKANTTVGSVPKPVPGTVELAHEPNSKKQPPSPKSKSQEPPDNEVVVSLR